MKAYGNLTNRIEEGRNYTDDGLIHVGDDITMYYWSDRTCYYVTEVISQKHIKVKRYEVVADHSKKGGMGHQNWLYFKTRKECNEYLSKFFGDIEENPTELEEDEWVFRYGKWKEVSRVDWFTGDVREKPLYLNLPGKISFGVRDYYYDWEF